MKTQQRQNDKRGCDGAPDADERLVFAARAQGKTLSIRMHGACQRRDDAISGIRKGMRVRYASGDCLSGRCLVAESEDGICAILLGESDAKLATELRGIFPCAQQEQESAAFAARVNQVIQYLDGCSQTLALALDMRGTAFQQRVWRALMEIPSGTTVSYQQVAQKIGQPRAVRAVAGACAANRLAIVIPCHRVTRRDGALSGYRWGVARKAWLLERESQKRSKDGQLSAGDG